MDEVEKFNSNNKLYLENCNVKEEFEDDGYVDVFETSVGMDDKELKNSLWDDRTKEYEMDDIKIELSSSQICNMNDSVKIENEVSTDDIEIKFDTKLLYCEHCNHHYEDYCPRCGMLTHILNSIALNMTDNEVIKEIPNNILEIRESSGHVGVFTLKVIPDRVKIGPFNGLSTSECPLRLKGGKFIVPEDKLNWMQYINPAKDIFQQNLTPFHCENRLYYHSSREILAGEELLVYFGEEYEDSVNSDIEMDFVAPTKDDVKDVFACTFCCLGFSSREYLAKHKSSCPNETNRIFSIDELGQCPLCKIYLYETEYLECHRPYCSERNVRFPVKSYYIIPLALANQTIKVNSRKTQRQTHIKSKHLRNLGYECDLCNHKVKWKSSLEKHIKTKHRKEFTYECEICNYKTIVKSHLEVHIKSKHLNEFSYECKRCDYKTNLSNNLQRHVESRHLRKFNYECEICDYKTKYELHFVSHMKIIHQAC